MRTTKEILGLIILTAILMSAFWYGLNKTIDNRCEYYKTLDMTEQMKELCK